MRRQMTLFGEQPLCNPFSLLLFTTDYKQGVRFFGGVRASAVTPRDQISSSSPLVIFPGKVRFCKNPQSRLLCECVHTRSCPEMQ